MKLNNKIKKGKLEFEKGDYNRALTYLNSVCSEDNDYKIALFYKISCHIKLEEYENALNIIDNLIKDNIYSEFLWFNKVLCHVFLKEDDEAYKTLSEVESVIDEYDKTQLLFIARLYKLIHNDRKALEYCDKALNIDEYYDNALYEKSLVSISLKDDKSVNEIANKLMECADNKIMSRLPIFLLKLFSKNYQDCYDLIVNSDADDINEEYVEMFKGIIFNHICDNFNVDIFIVNETDFTTDDALQILFDYINTGNDHGYDGEMQYFILKRKMI